MSHSYSADLRMRVIAAIWEGLSTRKAAARFDIAGIVISERWKHASKGSLAVRSLSGHSLQLLQEARHHIQKKTAHAAEQERPDVKARRELWFDSQPDLDPEKRVFIDETSASTKMTRLRGRAVMSSAEISPLRAACRNRSVLIALSPRSRWTRGPCQRWRLWWLGCFMELEAAPPPR